MNDQPDPTPRDRLKSVLRRPGMPAAGDHARLMLKRLERIDRELERANAAKDTRDRDPSRRPAPDIDIEEQWENTPTILARIGWLLMILGCLMLWSLIWIVLP